MALAQGCNRWLHKWVLGELAHILEREQMKERPKQKLSQHIGFIKEGQKSSITQPTCILFKSRCWEMKVDFMKKLPFLEEIAHTTL